MSKQSVADLFPNKTFEPIGGRPNGENLTDLRDKCLENLAAVPSILGGGQHGLAGLLLPDVDYLRETGHQFINPVNPGDVPNLAGCATVAQERVVKEQWLADMKNSQRITVAEAEIKRILVQVLDPVYLESMRQPLTGLANVSIKTIFSTLFAQHGKLTSNQITAASDMCKLPWDPAVPVQVVFNRIREAQDLVTRGENPFSDAQMLKFGYDTVLKTACFGDSLKAWRRKASADRTWANFQPYMVDEYDI